MLKGAVFVEVAYGSCGAGASGERALPVEAVDAGDAFQRGEDASESVDVVQLQRRFGAARRIVRGRVAAGRGEDAYVGVAEIADGVDERPHGHGFPVGGRIVVERYEQGDDVVGKARVGGVFEHAPGVGVRREQFIDEGDGVVFLRVWFEHVLAEFVEEPRAYGFVRDDEMQVGEEFLERAGVVAERVHDVVPPCGVGVACRRRYFGDGARLEHVRGRQRHSPHVHHVEDAVRAGEVVGGDDHQSDRVHQIGGEPAPFLGRHRGEHVEHLPGVEGDVALRVRRDVVVA